MNPRSSGPDKNPLSSEVPEVGTPAERGPERGPEFGMDPRGTGCKGRALKEDVLSKAEARSNRMLEKELNCSWEVMERGVAVLALTEAPEMTLKEVSDMDLGLEVSLPLLPGGARLLVVPGNLSQLTLVVADLLCCCSPGTSPLPKPLP
jgi:hypothetical protein